MSGTTEVPVLGSPQGSLEVIFSPCKKLFKEVAFLFSRSPDYALRSVSVENMEKAKFTLLL